MVKERPILFNGEMVRAILDGRKTQTRRVVNPQPHAGVRKSPFVPSGLEDGHGREIKLKYGRPGDRLWVRETWQPCGPWDCLDGMHIRLKADDSLFKPLNPPRPFLVENDGRDGLGKNGKQKWRPSIYMPRWASRISLEITDIRVERVQDISEADVWAEGVQLKASCKGSGLVSIGEKHSPYDYVQTRQKNESVQDVAMRAWKPIPHFAALWDGINAKRGYPWKDNPWVWVVKFKRVEV